MEQENLNIQESQQESIQEGSLRGGNGNNSGGNGPQTPFEDNRPETLEQKELLSNLNTGPQNLETTLEQQLLNNAPQEQSGLNENQEDKQEIKGEEPADEEIAPFVLEEEAPVEESTEEVGTEMADGGDGEGSDDGAIDAPELPPINPLDDPDFQGMEERIGEQGELMATHEDSGLLAESAQQGAPLAGNETMGLAQVQQVEEMSVQEPQVFDAAAFKEKLLQKINAILPKTEEDADEFEDNDGLGEVSQSVKESVDQEKENAGGPIETKTEEAPDTGEVVEREVEEIQMPEPGDLVTDLNVEDGMPDPREDTYVEEPVNDRVDQLDGLMEENEITDDQLANSNEPTFIESLNQKNEAKEESERAPQELRTGEEGILDNSQSSASGTNEEGLTQIFTDRENFLMQVMENQQSSSEENSAERARISGEIHDIYQQTKIDVESILSNLDTEVQARFDRAAGRAKSNFLSYVNAKMDAYKEERYDGIEGAFTWVGDAFTGLPDEVNAFYREGRNRYINEMDSALTDIADYIGQQLTAAKERITEGRQEVVDYVNELPDNLRSIGENAAGAIQARFDELDSTVDNKQGELINSLAQQYADSLNEVDEAIKAMQEANKGLIDAVLDAVGGVIETILEIKQMLTELVNSAIEVIGAIIADPIGFLSNLIDGVSQGIAGFVNNISDHLLTGLIEWLTGAMGSVGITLPENLFSFEGVLDLVAQILGLTWDYVREKAVYAIGEDAVQAIETGFEIFQILQTDGLVGVWEYIQGQLANLQEMIIGGIQEFLITSVIQAGVEWILGLLTPAGAFIKAAMAVIDIIKFFVENGSQIMALVQSIIDSLAAIVAGDVGFVAESVEAAMASAVPVLIGFLASLLGIDGLADKVQDIIKSIRKRIDDAITGLIDKAKDWFKGNGKDKRKAESEDDVSDEDRAKHKQYANEIEMDLKGMKPNAGESFEDFRQRIQARANELEKEYQPKLTEGIKIDISLTSTAKDDEKDGDVDVKVKIAPNTNERDLKLGGENTEKLSDIIEDSAVPEETINEEIQKQLDIIDSLDTSSYVFRGDDYYGGEGLGYSLNSDEAESADHQGFMTHVLEKKGDETSRYRSFSLRRSLNGGTKGPVFFASTIYKIELAALQALAKEGVIKIYTPTMVEAIMNTKKKKIKRKAQAVREVMEKHAEILIEGHIPDVYIIKT